MSPYNTHFVPGDVDPLGLVCRLPRQKDFPETIMPVGDPYWSVPRWVSRQKPSPIPIAGGEKLMFKDQAYGECIMDITVLASGLRYNRESPNGVVVGWGGGNFRGDYPRDFAGFLYVEVCYTNIRCECAAKPDYDVVLTRIFYRNGLGTFIEQAAGGMRGAAESFKVKILVTLEKKYWIISVASLSLVMVSLQVLTEQLMVREPLHGNFENKTSTARMLSHALHFFYGLVAKH
ncbi:MAG: hypothetical protein AAF939_21260 [Planctomycetota bacterium]